MHSKVSLAIDFADAYPQQAARILEQLASTETSAFIDSVPDRQSVSILASMLPHVAGRCIAALPVKSARKYLSGTNPKSAASILRHVPDAMADSILRGMRRSHAMRISILLNHSLSMVGAWLEPTILTLPGDCTVGEACKRLQEEDYPDFHRIYIEDGEQNLVGFVRLAHLIQEDDERPIANLMEPCPTPLRSNVPLDSALTNAAWRDSDFLPVVDRHHKFLGIIRYASLRSAALNLRVAENDNDTSGTFLDLAEACYIGLADVMNASLSIKDATHRQGAQHGLT